MWIVESGSCKQAHYSEYFTYLRINYEEKQEQRVSSALPRTVQQPSVQLYMMSRQAQLNS